MPQPILIQLIGSKADLTRALGVPDAHVLIGAVTIGCNQWPHTQAGKDPFGRSAYRTHPGVISRFRGGLQSGQRLQRQGVDHGNFQLGRGFGQC